MENNAQEQFKGTKKVEDFLKFFCIFLSQYVNKTFIIFGYIHQIATTNKSNLSNLCTFSLCDFIHGVGPNYKKIFLMLIIFLYIWIGKLAILCMDVIFANPLSFLQNDKIWKNTSMFRHIDPLEQSLLSKYRKVLGSIIPDYECWLPNISTQKFSN